MIDINVLRKVEASLPKMDKRVVEGIPYYQLLEAENYIHNTFKCAELGFPHGLKYLGGRRCTPLEQFKEITRPLNPTRVFELTKSDVYLMQYQFSYNGHPLRPQYMFLPFVSIGGLIHFRDTQYKLTPVIGGKVFNIEKGNIYMPNNRIRMGFWQFDVSCIKDNKIINQAGVGSYLFHIEKKTDRSDLCPTLLNYILTEYGLSRTLQEFFGVNIKIGNEELDDLVGTDWVVYKSRQYIPIGKKTNDFSVSKIRIAIPKNQHYSILDNIMATLFYIIDNCVESTQEIADLDNPLLWLRLLDKFIFKVPCGEQKLQERMEDHLQGMKNTLDPMTEKTLATDGIQCSTIFDLFKYICIHYQDITIHYDVGTMYYKELSSTKHLLYNIVYNIFKTMYELQKIPEHLLTTDKINKILGKHLKKERIFTTMGHGELTPSSIATTCMLHGATGNMISHNKATAVGGKQKGRGLTNDPGLALHESQCEAATYLWITGKGPLGREKINPFINFSERYLITPNPELADDINALQQLLTKRKS